MKGRKKILFFTLIALANLAGLKNAVAQQDPCTRNTWIICW